MTSRPAACSHHESTAQTESGHQINHHYSLTKVLFFPFICDNADVPGNAKGLLSPTAKIPLHDGGRSKSPTLPFPGARSSWSLSVPFGWARMEQAGLGAALGRDGACGKGGRVAAGAYSPITFHRFASQKQDTSKKSCALSDLQTRWLYGKPQEVFFSAEAPLFIDILSNIQA